MSTITSPELVELDGKIAAKRAIVGTVLNEAGPELDMSKVKCLDGDSAAKVAAFRALDAELNELTAKAAPLREVLAIANVRHAEGAADEDAGSEKGDSSERGEKRHPSLAEAYLKSESRFNKGREYELPDFDVKTVFSTGAGWAPFAPRIDRVVPYATRPIELLDFLPTAPMASSSFTYMEETTFTNAAVETSEGILKPEATLALTERTATARKIPVFLPVTDEQLEDVPGVQAYIENRLPFMVRQRLAGQIIAGDGTPPNIQGILNVSGIQTQAKSTDPTPDAVYKAMTKIRVTGQAEPDAVVFHPNDWQDVRLLRTSDGIYIWGSPSEAGPEMIWGLKVLQAQAMTENTAVVGAWQMFSTLYIRKGLTVETGLNADDWTKNKQTIRAEIRAVPVFWRPAAFCTVTGI